MSERTLENFTAALALYGAAKGADEAKASRDLVNRVTPPGLSLMPTSSGLALKVHARDNLWDPIALFYLNEHRARKPNPERVRLAWAAILGLSAAIEPKPAAPRHRFEVVAADGTMGAECDSVAYLDRPKDRAADALGDVLRAYRDMDLLTPQASQARQRLEDAISEALGGRVVALAIS